VKQEDAIGQVAIDLSASFKYFKKINIKIKKVKLSPYRAVKAHKVVRRRGSHIF
jgi:hypothetical protein